MDWQASGASGKTTVMKWNSKLFLWALLTAGLTVVFFLPVLRGEFLSWDDNGLFVENPYFRGLSPKHWQWMCRTFWFGHWQPLSWLSYALDYTLWGMNPHRWHVTNLVLHTVNAMLVYWLCLAFLRRRTHPALTGTPPKEGIFEAQVISPLESNPLHGRGGRNEMTDGVGYHTASALAALFWAVHPLRVEAVAWLATRGYLLCTTFCLLTLLFYVWRGHPCLRIRAGRDACPTMYWAALLCFALATATKGIGMMLPMVLLLADWLNGDVQGCGSKGVRGWWRKRVAEKIPFFALAVLTGITAFLAKKMHGGMASVEQYGMPERIGQAAYGIWFYLLKTVSPLNLSPLYNKHPEVWQILTAPILLAAVLIVLFLFRRRLRPVIGTFGAFALLIFPMLGITQSGAQLFADRFTYLAAIPFSILMAAGLSRLKTMRRIIYGALTVLLLIFGLQTFIYSGTWGRNLTLWEYAVNVDGNSGEACNNKGLALLDLHHNAEALECIDRAVKINPLNTMTRHNRALALAQMGRYDEALDEWERALSSSGNSKQGVGKIKLARGWVFGRIGNFEAAERDYSSVADDTAIDLIRRSGALQLRAAIFIQTGRPERAEADLLEMLNLSDIGKNHHEKAQFVLNWLKKIPGE
jgi:tetratricopeptide (TPR) repeat protein